MSTGYLRKLSYWVSAMLNFLFCGVVVAQDATCLFHANGVAIARIEYRYQTADGEVRDFGSGFIISPQGHLITAAHVVSPRSGAPEILSESVEVRLGSVIADAFRATIIVRDSSNDLALLKLHPHPSGSAWPTVTVGNPIVLPVGTPLAALGFAAGADLAVVPDGKKTANNTVVLEEMKPWWQTNLALNSGNSGGPIFGPLGTVVGVAVLKGSGVQLISYIVPINRAQHLLDAANVRAATAGRCAVFPECRHAMHGVSGYQFDEIKSRWGQWRRGGYNRGAFCNDFLAELQAQFPNSTFTFVRDDERNRDASPPFRVMEYQYYCEFRRRESPIYELKRSISCLQ